jgi:hypothetical protein
VFKGPIQRVVFPSILSNSPIFEWMGTLFEAEEAGEIGRWGGWESDE